MKRSEDSRIIKIPDPSSVQSLNAPTSAQMTVVQKNPQQQQQTSASIAPVFPQRPSVIEIPGQPLQAHRGGVTVYRGESAATVISSAVPPAAHSGIVVTATPSAGLVQPPSAVLHGPPQSVTPIKPEAISKWFKALLAIKRFLVSLGRNIPEVLVMLYTVFLKF